MKSVFSFIAAIIVSPFHAPLSQSVSKKVSNVDTSCFQPAVLREYLLSTLYTLHNPASIFIITDSMNDLNFYRNSNLLADTTIAILNISMISEINYSVFCETKLFIVMDLSEEYIETVTKEVYIKHKNINQCAVKWQPSISIIWKSSSTNYHEQRNILQNILQATPLHFDSTIFVYFPENVIPSSPSLKLNVWEVYSIKSRRIFEIVNSIYINELDIGSSSTNVALQLGGFHEELESFAKRRRNFHMESLVASVKFDPNYQDWVSLITKDDGGHILTGGYVASLYWDLKLLMNFSEHVLVGDSPTPFPNGSLGGTTVEQLLSNEIDLTLNQISFSGQRAKVLTFLQPTYFSLNYVFFKQPSTNSVQDIVVVAFQKELWITVIGVWATLVISIKVRLAMLSKNDFSLLYPAAAFQGDRKFAKESVLWSVAALCQKTWHLDPWSTSLRMQVMIGSVVGFLIYTAYSGSIVSTLAINKIPVKNFNDLINFNFIFTVHEQSETFQTMLKGMITSYALKQDVKTIYTVAEVSHLFVGSSARGTLRSSKAAFLSPADMFYKTAQFLNYTDVFVCDEVSSFSTGMYISKSAMLVKKGSQFKEVLNFMLAYLRGRGFIYRNIDKYKTDNFLKCVPIDQQDNEIEPASWIDIFTIVLILSTGFLLSTLLLFIEVGYNYYRERNIIRVNDQNIMLHALYDMRNHYYPYACDRMKDTYYIA